MEKRLNAADIPVALRLLFCPGEKFKSLANALGIAPSAAHRSVSRLQDAGLLLPDSRQVHRLALNEYLKHGVRYSFFAAPGVLSRGVPTAYAAPPLSDRILFDRAVVWPSSQGDVEGISIAPLYKQAPELPERDPALYEALALVDALRIGGARERKLAEQFLDETIFSSRRE